MTFEQDLIDILTNEIEQLRVDYNEASIDGAADERAKIVAWLLNLKEMSDCYVDHIEAGEIAAYITRGEHLK